MNKALPMTLLFLAGIGVGSIMELGLPLNNARRQLDFEKGVNAGLTVAADQLAGRFKTEAEAQAELHRHRTNFYATLP